MGFSRTEVKKANKIKFKVLQSVQRLFIIVRRQVIDICVHHMCNLYVIVVYMYIAYVLHIQ